MKRFSSIILTLLVVLMVGCKDDSSAAGTDALRSDEQVRVYATTFGAIDSKTDSLDGRYIVQTPDSFLLGVIDVEDWSTIRADVLAQFACPVGKSFPETAVIDSATLLMAYTSWFGNNYSPLRISVYEMDRNALQYDSVYSCQIDTSRYWSGEDSTLIAECKVTPALNTDTIYSAALSSYVSCVRVPMNKRFQDKLLRMHTFPNKQQEFCDKYFKGLYISTTFGMLSALYIRHMEIVVYYHYTYVDEKGQLSTLYDVKRLYANNEVRQVNRFSFPNKASALKKLQARSDSFNFVVSPAYMYTMLNIPIKQYVDTIKQSMQNEGRDALRPYVNKAAMRVEVTNGGETTTSTGIWASPASDMLLIVADSINGFFLTNGVPSSDYCLVSSLASEYDSSSKLHYYYNFDLSTILQQALRSKTCPDSVRVVMVPVHVEYATTSTTTTISKVKFNQTITFTQIQSAQFKSDPLDVDVVYSGVSVVGM